MPENYKGYMRLETDALKVPTYAPVRFIDFLKLTLNKDTDYALSKRLGLSPVYISKLRYKKMGLSNGLLLYIHDVTGIPIKTMKEISGLPIFKRRVNNV